MTHLPSPNTVNRTTTLKSPLEEFFKRNQQLGWSATLWRLKIVSPRSLEIVRLHRILISQTKTMAERIEIKRNSKKKSGYEVEKRQDGCFYSESRMAIPFSA
jgi:hypothetical protein